MPIYEYRCPVCQAKHEVIRPVADKDKLPTCHTCKVEMPISVTAAGMRFLGKGWTEKGGH